MLFHVRVLYLLERLRVFLNTVWLCQHSHAVIHAYIYVCTCTVTQLTGDVCYVVLFMSELQKKPVDGFSAGLVDDDDIYKWEVLIMGPPDTY